MKHFILAIIFAIEAVFLIVIDVNLWQKMPKVFEDKVNSYALGAFAIVAVYAFFYHMTKYVKKQNYDNLHY